MRDYSKGISSVGGLMGAIYGGVAGASSGMLLRAKAGDYHKKKKDRSFKEDSIMTAPFYGAIGGAAGGYLGGKKFLFKDVKDKVRAASELSKGFHKRFHKRAALNSDVELRTHQTNLHEKLERNDGSILAAHATGTGKTLTGVSAFERLKELGKAKRALVVVPASLRENFADNGVKKFTDSSVTVYGPKGERSTKDIGQKSDSDYNVVSYELFRDHGEKLLEDTGADTLILDEVHRVRGTEGVTYNRLRELRPNFKQAITMTGSVVNNEPNDVVPLMDITFGPTGHRLVNKAFFDKLFVNKQAKTYGIFKPKVHVEKSLKNRAQLRKYLDNKIDYISHDELDDMPGKKVETVKVPMTQEQSKLYDFTLASVDPITRWKIRNNMPVGSKEAKDAFSKLMLSRQISTDPAVLDKGLKDKNPYDYSPKVKKVVDDALEHLGQDGRNRTVIYGNLVNHQVGAVRQALENMGVEYAQFLGTGQEGVTQKTRSQAVKDFNDNKKRVLLISGAGAEGLDLKDGTMLQMLEGHYNPERIQQAEARIRRMGALKDRPIEDRNVLIKRYVAEPTKSGVISKGVNAALKLFGAKVGNTGVDEWIYNLAEKKDGLNSQFRETLKKQASGFFKAAGLFDSASFESIMSGGVEEHLGVMASAFGESAGSMLGSMPGNILGAIQNKKGDVEIEKRIKQELLDRGLEALTSKKHYQKVLSHSKIDERAVDATMGVGGLALSLPLLMTMHPRVAAGNKKLLEKLTGAARKVVDLGIRKSNKLDRIFGNKEELKGLASKGLAAAAVGGTMATLSPPATAILKNKIRSHMIGLGDLGKGVDLYTEELRRKAESKYKSSKGYVSDYETKQELGIDPSL